MQSEPPILALARSGRRIDSAANWLAETLERHKGAVLAVFSIVYFGLTFYRASRKLFWFDELFTVYLCRLPDFKSVWHAVLNGADFNPPLLYLVTQFSERIFGEGHIATRLPEILGFWVFCLCLFRFVSLRLSVLSACVSLLFPLVTGAYWYAYEARAHGLVLGFCGIALVSWQAAAENTARRGWWLFALGGSLACSLLTHSFAFLIFAPIIFGELWRTKSGKHLDWPVWTTIGVSSLALLASIPLVSKVVTEAGSQPSFLANLVRLRGFYRALLIPNGAEVLVGWLILTCMFYEEREGFGLKRGFRSYEVFALWAFVAIPVFEYGAAKFTGAPFLSRYSVSAIAGFAGVLGAAVSKRPALALGTILLIAAQIGLDFKRFASGSVLVEPSSNYQLSTRIHEFGESYEWMADDKTLPIVVLDELDFLPISFYAPVKVAPQLVYVAWPKLDINGKPNLRWWIGGQALPRLRACCNSELAIVELADFLAWHDAFLVYGRPSFADRMQYFVNDGATVKTKRESGDHYLVLVTYKKRSMQQPFR
jgi:hypothetical protein